MFEAIETMKQEKKQAHPYLFRDEPVVAHGDSHYSVGGFEAEKEKAIEAAEIEAVKTVGEFSNPHHVYAEPIPVPESNPSDTFPQKAVPQYAYPSPPYVFGPRYGSVMKPKIDEDQLKVAPSSYIFSDSSVAKGEMTEESTQIHDETTEPTAKPTGTSLDLFLF